MLYFLGRTYHVEADEAHDNHVELFVGDDTKDDGLRAPRGPRQGLHRLLPARLLHRRNVLLLVLRHEGVQGAAALVLLLVELVYDDTDQQVEGEEGAEDDEEDKVEIHEDGVLAVRLLVELQRGIDEV